MPANATWETVRQLVLALPAVEESASYGTPALKVHTKLFARLHQDGENVVVRIEKKDRARRMLEKPETFHVTQHYVGYPYMLVSLRTVSWADLREVLFGAWRLAAPRELVVAHDHDARNSLL
jgi:hypothetical protein